MALYPKIDSPCPLKNAMFDGNFCKLCERHVHDISAMSDSQRISFMQGCDDQVCVSYTVSTGIPTRKVIHTAVLAAAVSASAGVAAPAVAQEVFCPIYEMVLVGGVKDPGKAEWIDTEAEKDLVDLPVIVEPHDQGVPAKHYRQKKSST